ncbi:hypothetical protein K443DRAFT_680915 [Laccaria amethystina LaAM-08-1]|jgi:hypothetical protein|uniref:Uncharacterized protein n=1 Tax=Laccaria amethystina LaAM-08-1 TaxID=1095629 RepID=A0A0C9XQA6_9AGAR|nr:hypothetical protein K443DRAFT_680915 [Laccaria amethystina LaAM-08-1]
MSDAKWKVRGSSERAGYGEEVKGENNDDAGLFLSYRMKIFIVVSYRIVSTKAE